MEFITLQTLDGRLTFVNPKLVVSVAEPRHDSGRTLSDKVECVVTFVDGKFITVVETCASIKQRMEARK